MADSLSLIDLTSEETVTALSEWHYDEHLIEMVEMVGPVMGLIWYFLAPLAAGAIPIVFHYLYRPTYFATFTSDTYYELGW